MIQPALRRRLKRVGYAGAMALALLIARPGAAMASDRQPNVVLFVADDLGWTDTAAGSNFYETPNIEQFRGVSLNFTSGYAACPVCSPTRCSLLTGMNPARTALTFWLGSGETGGGSNTFRDPDWADQIPADAHTLAETMRDAGYHTAHIGKWHLGERGSTGSDPLRHGFEVNVGGNHRGSPPPDSDRAHRYFADENGAFDAPGLGPNGKNEQFLPERLSEEMTAYIRSNADRPFFLNMSHFAVHTPIGAPADRVAYFRDKLDNPPAGGFTHRDATYAALVEGIDKSFGQLLNTLNETRDADGEALIENTIVLFVSDNGGYAGHTNVRPLREAKGSIYEGGTRVPFMLYAPGMTAAGEDCDVPVSTDDVYETVMTLTGLKNPNGATDGVSLANLLHDPDADIGRESIHWHYPHYRHDGQSGGKPSSAVRRGDWKLYYFYEGQDYELYNLAADIGESHNLAHDRPDMLHLLSTDLHNWLKDTGAQMPIYTETGQPAPLPAITPEPTGAALLISGAVGLCAGPRRRARAPRRAPAPRG